MKAQIVSNSDYLHLKVSQSPFGLFAKSVFQSGDIICEVRGRIFKIPSLSKIKLSQSTKLHHLYDNYYISPTNISQFLSDTIIKPNTKQQYLRYEKQGYQYKSKHNAIIKRIQDTNHKLFVIAQTKIEEQQQILIQYDIALWKQIFLSQFGDKNQ